MDEAVYEHELAVELDPLYPPQIAFMGEMYRLAGRHDDALSQVEKALELDSRTGNALLVRGNVFLEQGRFDEAIAEHERMAELNRAWKGMLGATYAAAGRFDDALDIAEEIESRGPNSFEAIQLVFLYSQLGDADNAFKWLDHEPGHIFVAWLGTNWAPLHLLSDDPRYEAFMRRLNIPRSTGPMV